MSSKYVDISAILQVIGCIYNNPKLLDFTDKYNIFDEDFDNSFHKIIFGAIYTLYFNGSQDINLEIIGDFLNNHPQSNAVYKANNGDKWLLEVSENADPLQFDYYYNRMKKMSLLRAYDNYGIDVSEIYDPDNLLDLKKKQLQEDILDNSTLEELADKIDNRISDIRMKFVNGSLGEASQAGDDIFELIDKFKQYPEVGIPLYGPLINTITRGARLKKFYLRSAATGTGKSRTMVADACNFACSKIYDDGKWIDNGTSEPALFITTEQELEEVQTMMLAFVSEVNEEHIINGRYIGNEEDRVRQAAEILVNSPLYIEELPDFSLRDMEDKIKKNIRDHDVKYVCVDYIHTSMKILEEITKRSGGVKLREDNVLFMFSNKLKDICNQYGVFILSATQLNGSYQDAETPDQNLLRGAKAIADKIDFGSILLNVREHDLKALESVLSSNVFDTPDLKLSIYKNRRGRYKGIYLWCKADLGCCRVKPMFATTYDYELIQIDDLKIDVKGAF